MLGRQRDLETLRQQLETWLRAKLARAEHVAVLPLKKPSAGVSNETVLFDAVVRENGSERRERLVARLTPTSAPVFPEYDLQRQFRVLQCLATTDIPVPNALWFETDERVIGSPFYVMRAVAGDIPSEIPPYHAFGYTLQLSTAQRAQTWWNGIDVLARIHAVDWRDLGLSFLGVPADAGDAIDRQLDYYERYLQWAGGDRPQPILDTAIDWLKRNRYTPRRVSLCWGDSRLPNMIFQGTEVAAVLDWEMAFIGDPEADLAWWLFLDWCHSTGYGIPRLEGLPSEAETVARYEQLSGYPVEHLHYQKVMAAVRYGVITVRVVRLMLAAQLPIANQSMETDNTCTQWLAQTFDLPPPGVARAVTDLAHLKARIQFHLTGSGAADWYIVAANGQGTRHVGTISDPDVTLTADAADWRAIQSGELNRTQAFMGGKLRIEGDVTLLMQLEDLIARLNADA